MASQHKVFVSYVSENFEVVTRLRRDLERKGIEVWLDKDRIAAGKRWRSEIRNAICDGDFFLAFFSEEYLKRRRTYMGKELSIAVEELNLRPKDKAWFIPVLLSNCQVPDINIGGGETLQDIQSVSLFEDWELGIEKISRAIIGENQTQYLLRSILPKVRDLLKFASAVHLEFSPLEFYTDSLLQIVKESIDSFGARKNMVAFGKELREFIYHDKQISDLIKREDKRGIVEEITAVIEKEPHKSTAEKIQLFYDSLQANLASYHQLVEGIARVKISKDTRCFVELAAQLYSLRLRNKAIMLDAGNMTKNLLALLPPSEGAE